MMKITIQSTLIALLLAGCESSAPAVEHAPPEAAENTRADEHTDAPPRAGRAIESATSAVETKPEEAKPEPEAPDAFDAPSVLREARIADDEDEECRLRLNQLVIASNVEKREPVLLEGTVPANGKPVYGFADLHHLGDEKETISLVWTHPESGHSATYELEVGKNKNFRTWARHRIPTRREGTWLVRVEDSEGCVLGETSFEAAREDIGSEI